MSGATWTVTRDGAHDTNRRRTDDRHKGPLRRDGATLGAQPHIRHERTLGLLGVLLLSPSPARVVSVGMLAVGTVLALVVGAGMARQAGQRER